MKIATLFGSKGVAHSHLWLEGKALTDAGFSIGTEYTQLWDKNKLIMVVGKANPVMGDGHLVLTVYKKVTAGGKQPAIRIEGKRVRETFRTEKVVVTYGIERITVEPYIEQKNEVVTPVIKHVGSDRQEVGELADMGVRL